MMRISELQAKEIVNLNNGKRLGHISDLHINLETGKIDAIVIHPAGKMMSLFNREPEVTVKWKNIVKIGSDVILVRLNEQYSPVISKVKHET